MSENKEPQFNPKVKITDDDQHILYELTNEYELKDFNLIRNFRSTAARYHPDKNQNSDDAERKFRILNTLHDEFKSINNNEELKELIIKYQSVYTNSSIPNGFGKKKGPAPKQTEDNPISPIKPEDKKFFDSFKKNYYEKSFAIPDTLKFNDQGLEKCFVSFRDREYKRFVKSTNKSGTIEFKHSSTFDKANYENYIFFPDQPNPETPSHDQIILESYKQAVKECQIAKPNDLTNPEKPSQDKAGDEYTILKFREDFIKSYKASTQTRGINTNTTYLIDRLRDRIEIFTGKKTKDDIEPKAPEKRKTIDRESSKDYKARILEYETNVETFKTSYAEYEALNSKFDELCKNDNVKTFLDKEKTKYLQEKEAQEKKLKEAKEAEERKLKERENSIEERWSRFSKSLLELQEDASSRLAGVSSKIGSSLGSASSAVRGFNSNFLESAKNGVDSLIEISTSVTTSITQASSNAMDFLTSIPQIKINSPSDETDAQKNTKTSPEPQKQEPKTSNTGETLGKKIGEELKRREQAERRVAEAIKMAQAASLRAKEASQKAPPPTAQMRRTSSAPLAPTRNPPPANNQRASSFSTELPRREKSEIAFFGPRAQQHAANHPDKKQKPEPNGPSRPNASSLYPRPSKKPRTQ